MSLCSIRLCGPSSPTFALSGYVGQSAPLFLYQAAWASQLHLSCIRLCGTTSPIFLVFRLCGTASPTVLVFRLCGTASLTFLVSGCVGQPVPPFQYQAVCASQPHLSSIRLCGPASPTFLVLAKMCVSVLNTFVASGYVGLQLYLRV